MEYKEFVRELRESTKSISFGRIFPRLPTRKNREQKETTAKSLEDLLRQPEARQHLSTMNAAALKNKKSTKLLTPLRSFNRYALWTAATQALTSTYHFWTLDRKDYFGGWEDPNMPIWAGGGPDLFWRERIEDHGLAFLLGLGAGTIHLLHKRISQREGIEKEFQKYEQTEARSLTTESNNPINRRELQRISGTNYKTLRALISDLNQNGYFKPEEPELAKRKTDWYGIAKTAGIGAVIGIVHGALYNHSGTHHDIQTLIKNLCCRPSDTYRERFIPDAIQYFQTFKPIIWGGTGAMIANTPRMIKESFYRIKNYFSNDNRKP